MIYITQVINGLLEIGERFSPVADDVLYTIIRNIV